MGVLAGLWALAAADVVWRSRSALRRGEAELAAGRPSLAAAWFENAASDFVPPESRWSRRARERLPEARRRAEAQAQEEARRAARPAR